MDVTRENFLQLFPQIQADIKNANFVSFDCEFSGLGSNLKESQPDLLDSPAARYAKVSRTCTEFLPLQIGICTFEYREKEDFYIAKPYNFYVFPKTGNRFFQLDRCFSTQISSLEFLLSHHFDWNKWATQGVPFVNHDDYERIMEKLGAEDFDAPSPPEKGESLYDFSQDAIALARDFLQNSTEKTLQIPAPSAYHKRIIHISIAKNFNGFLGTTSKPTLVELVKYTEEEREEASAKSRYTTLKAELEELVGFRRVIDALVEAKVPLAGHNLLHDLCFMFENFYRQLPFDFEDFKSQVHDNFPLIIDTKLIAQTSPLIQTYVKNTVLTDMAKVFQNSPFSDPKVVYGREFTNYVVDTEMEEGQEGGGREHEAGYDAYITGLSLLRMYSQIVKPEKGECIDLHSDVCQPNRIFMMRSLITYMNLQGDDPKPDTSNVFLMSRFPANWKAGDIQHALKEIGFINLKWLDDQSCLVIIRDTKKIAVAQEITKRVYKKSSPFMLKAFIDTASSSSSLYPLESNGGEIKGAVEEGPSRKRPRTDGTEAAGAVAKKSSAATSAKSRKGCCVM